jgi:Ca2+/H+ antiporter, TMEM165/GDT1 family
MEKQNYWRKRRPFFLIFILFGLFSVSAVIMLLWNFIIPEISSLKVISYWQAMGLFLLCRILFGGFRFRQHHQRVHKHFTKVPFKNRFMEMSDEEKQQFKNQWKKHCC